MVAFDSMQSKSSYLIFIFATVATLSIISTINGACINKAKGCVNRGPQCENNDYSGSKKVTTKGDKCRNETLCRNPKNDTNGPWCNTDDGWGYCFPDCNPSKSCIRKKMDCAIIKNNACKNDNYEGDKNKQKDGKKCVDWIAAMNWPRFDWNSTSVDLLTLFSAGDHCRNPDNHVNGPWCYAADKSRGFCFDTCFDKMRRNRNRNRKHRNKRKHN